MSIIENQEIERMDYYESWAYTVSIMPLNGKIAIEKEWSKWSYTRRPFNRNEFIGKNAGIICGPASGIIVLDVDDQDSFAKYCENNQITLPDTFAVVSSPGRGHYYFKYPTDGKTYGCKQCKDHGFDIRGVGGYIVAPGSIHPVSGTVYAAINQHALCPAPEWLLSLAEKTEKPEKTTLAEPTAASTTVYDIGPVDLDTLGLSEELKHLIRTAIPKGVRSEVEMSVINKLVNAGINDQTIMAIMEQYPIGEKHREKGDARFTRMEAQLNKARRFLKESGQTKLNMAITKTLGNIIDNDPKLVFLVQNLWVKGETLMLYGAGGVGKSLLALQLMVDLARKHQVKFLGKFAVKPGNRIYLVQSEFSAAGINNRIKTMYGHNTLNEDIRDNIIFQADTSGIATTGNFMSDAYCEGIIEKMHEHQCNVLVIDPLISFHTANENENMTMRKVLDNIKQVGQRANASVLLIHHSGKPSKDAKGNQSRGASSIGDWAASSMELVIRDSMKHIFELKHTKARDMAKVENLLIKRQSNLQHYVTDKLNDSVNDYTQLFDSVLQKPGIATLPDKKIIEEVKRLMENNGIDPLPSDSTIRRRLKEYFLSVSSSTTTDIATDIRSVSESNPEACQFQCHESEILA